MADRPAADVQNIKEQYVYKEAIMGIEYRYSQCIAEYSPKAIKSLYQFRKVGLASKY